MNWITSKDLLSLPCMPSAISSINRRAKKYGWTFRQKKGVRGVTYEYLIDSLPKDVQHAICELHISQLMAAPSVPDVVKKTSTKSNYKS